jgi:hypothetical protein
MAGVSGAGGASRRGASHASRADDGGREAGVRRRCIGQARKLGALLAKGLITQAEFDQARPNC